MITREGRSREQPSPDPGGALVRLRDVRKSFGAPAAPVRALRGVTLDVERGEFVALLGASGSGKSTLLSIIAGLERHDDGDVVVAGLDLGGATRRQLSELRRRHVAVVFRSSGLLEQLTVVQNVALAAQVAGERTRAAQERAGELLDKFGLRTTAGDYPATLSGSARQRVAIARALAGRPELLLADEPTGSLDSTERAEIVAVLGQVHAEGQSILLATHDPSVAAVAERTVVLRDGSVAEQAGFP